MRHAIFSVIFTVLIMSCVRDGNDEPSGAKTPKSSGDSIAIQQPPDGEAIYFESCALCHENGLAGAASYNDAERWQESIDKGIETLIENAVNGYRGRYGNMPALGGCSDCDRTDMEAAVRFMIERSGVTD